MSLTFEKFHAMMPRRKIALGLLRSYYEAGKLAGSIGQTPWAWSETKALPDLEHLTHDGRSSAVLLPCGSLETGPLAESAESVRARVNRPTSEQSEENERVAEPTFSRVWRLLFEQAVFYELRGNYFVGRLKCASKGPLKIKKWMLR